MNNIIFPAQFGVLCRRLVNVVSTLTLSNQYFLLKKAQEEEANSAGGTSSSERTDSIRSPLSLGQLADESVSFGERTGKAMGLSWPQWSWSRIQLSLNNSTTPNEPSGPSRAPSEPVKTPRLQRRPVYPEPLDPIHRLMSHPTLFEPVRRPRFPIVLCHGLYGFDTKGPAAFGPMRMTYWRNVLDILRNTVGAEVIVTSVPGTGSIASRSEALDAQVQSRARGRGVNFLAHSMGGLDCRHLITHLRPQEYTPLSLTCVATPHRGSPFMDWCASNIGIGQLKEDEERLAKALLSAAPPPPEPPHKPESAPFSLSISALPSSFTTLLLGVVDSPAYANLTTSYLNTVFNPATPNLPGVRYFSVAARMDPVSVWHPFWLPKMVLDGVESKARARIQDEWSGLSALHGSTTPPWDDDSSWGNDGLVTVQSAKWGEFLGTMEGCDHWEMRGARGIDLNVDLKSVPMMGGLVSSDGWSLKDWGRFVGAWKKEERRVGAENAAASGVANETDAAAANARTDAEVKSSTDRISAVFDWLVEQVPLVKGNGREGVGAAAESKGKTLANDKRTQEMLEGKKVKERRHDLATKADLETFYVALCRKMYDEGL